MGRSFKRKAAEVILPPKSASLMPYGTGHVTPLPLLAISPSTFIILAQEQAFPGKGLLLYSGRWDLWTG